MNTVNFVLQEEGNSIALHADEDAREKNSSHAGQQCGKKGHTTSTLAKPIITRFFSSSHPIPPAPTTNTLEERIFWKISGPKT